MAGQRWSRQRRAIHGLAGGGYWAKSLEGAQGDIREDRGNSRLTGKRWVGRVGEEKAKTTRAAWIWLFRSIAHGRRFLTCRSSRQN